MKRSVLMLTVASLFAFALVAGPATASGTYGKPGARAASVTVVHGVPNLLVDVYVVNNFERRRLDDVAFGAVATLELRPGFAYVAILPADDRRFSRPIFQRFFWLERGDNLSAAAYLTEAGAPAFKVFRNNVSDPGSGKARVIVRHLAQAPAVDILAGGTPVISGLVNGGQGSLVVPGGTYPIAVAPAGSTTAVFGPASLTFGAGTTTIVYAVGSLPGGTFTPLVQVF
jgi:hypothetical protein